MERFFQEQLEKCGVSYFATTCSTICPGHIMKQLSVWGVCLCPQEKGGGKGPQNRFSFHAVLSFWRRFFQNT